MTIEVSKEIYPLEVIQQAIEAFRPISKIRIDDGDQYWTCSATRSKNDLQETLKEFENYLIGLINLA